MVPGLYACGEVLDIDGDCGGYNLQWAWSSGAAAAAPQQKKRKRTMLRISQIKLNPEEPVSLLPKKIGQKLRIRNFQPKNWKIVKESIECQGKTSHSFDLYRGFDVDDEDGLLVRRLPCEASL